MPDIPIVVLGSGGVGKSCLTLQYIQGHFVDKYDATIEDVYRKHTDIDNEPVVLTIVDTAGEDAFAAMREQYLRKGQGFLLVYSITDADSFQQLKGMYAQLRRIKGEQYVPCVVVGNKTDEVNYRVVSTEEGHLLAFQAQCPFLEVTAKKRGMVEEVFETLLRTVRHGGIACDQKRGNSVGGTAPHTGSKVSEGMIPTLISENLALQPLLPSAVSPPVQTKKKNKKKSRCVLL